MISTLAVSHTETALYVNGYCKAVSHGQNDSKTPLLSAHALRDMTIQPPAHLAALDDM